MSFLKPSSPPPPKKIMLVNLIIGLNWENFPANIKMTKKKKKRNWRTLSTQSFPANIKMTKKKKLKDPFHTKLCLKQNTYFEFSLAIDSNKYLGKCPQLYLNGILNFGPLCRGYEEQQPIQQQQPSRPRPVYPNPSPKRTIDTKRKAVSTKYLLVDTILN